MKQYKGMSKNDFVQDVLFKLAGAYANRETWNETDFEKAIREYDEANNVYGMIDWEDLYDEDGEYVGVRVEDETFTNDWYIRYKSEENN